jgi:hypothetical protein
MLLIAYIQAYDRVDKKKSFALLEAGNVETCMMNTLKCPL